MRRDAEEHRTRLLEAARRVFTRDGVAAPLAAVLDESKLGRGTLYRHFRDRSALLLALIHAEVDDLCAFVASHRGEETLVRAFLRRQANAASLYMEMAETIFGQGMVEPLRILQDRADRLHREVIVRGRAAGTLAATVDLRAFRLIGRLLMPARQQCLQEGSGRPLEEALDLLFAGIGPRAGS